MRWPILLLGVCFLILSTILLIVYGILLWATSCPGLGCGSTVLCPCAPLEFVLVPALVLLALGVVFVVGVVLDLG
jgi:hypothetical protein